MIAACGTAQLAPTAEAPHTVAQSRCRCGRGEPSPGADVAAVSPVPVPMWAGVGGFVATRLHRTLRTCPQDWSAGCRAWVVRTLYTANVVGVLFSRTLHYQSAMQPAGSLGAWSPCRRMRSAAKAVADAICGPNSPLLLIEPTATLIAICGGDPKPTLVSWTQQFVPDASAPGPGLPLPHLHRDRARPAHICIEIRLPPATS
jgi:hypothetical protein